MGRREKIQTYREIKAFLIHLTLMGSCIAISLLFFIGISFEKNSHMSPTLQRGDFCLTLKVFTPERDMICLYRRTDGTLQSGRILALAGDKLELTERDEVAVNGIRSGRYLHKKTFISSRVPAGQVFILNDNASVNDSGFYGLVPCKNLSGRLFLLFRRDFP